MLCTLGWCLLGSEEGWFRQTGSGGNADIGVVGSAVAWPEGQILVPLVISFCPGIFIPLLIHSLTQQTVVNFCSELSSGNFGGIKGPLTLASAFTEFPAQRPQEQAGLGKVQRGWLLRGHGLVSRGGGLPAGPW